jgi:hypothetical protein
MLSFNDCFSDDTKMTVDHNIIKHWIEERGGEPAKISKPDIPVEEEGVLRIKFRGFQYESNLVPISWSDFFTKFDQSNLAFVYEEKTPDGELSRFFRFVSMDGE